MDLSPRQVDELHELLWRLRAGTASPEQLSRLERLVCEDPQARTFYVRYMHLCADLNWNGGVGNEGQETRGSGLDIRDSELSSPQLEATTAEPTIPPLLFTPSLSTTHYPLPANFVGGPVFSYLVATLILGVMLISAWAYKITHFQPQFVEAPPQSVPPDARPELVFVGRITGMKDCRWSDPQTEAYLGASVPLGRKYALASGLMEIAYKTGTRVILEGPCTYEVDSPAGGYLSLGKLTARIEERREKREERAKSQAANHTSPSPLFSVRTPTAVITDLGTEFGVEVGTEGNTTSHVFRGLVRVITVGGGSQQNVVLRENESAIVKMNANLARLITGDDVGDPPKFVRRLVEPPKLLDLLDIVAGGDGTGRNRERGIDPLTGNQDTLFICEDKHGDGRYLPVPWHGLIDGVVCPKGKLGSVQIDSAGHTFDGFGPSNGMTLGSIWVRAATIKPIDKKRNRFCWVYSMGDGGEFMPRQRGLLGLHANAGVTFDLRAVRAMHKEVRPARFRATTGLADAPDVLPEADGVADLWVFVDGKLQWKRKGFRRRDGVVKIDVAIGKGDRFLSLVSTDSDGKCGFDWVVLGDPVLELESTESDN